MHGISGQFLQPYCEAIAPWLYVNSYWWSVVGFAGNLMFGSRFVFQWLASERKQCLVVPAYFWYLSFVGSVFNLFYALHLDNAPLLIGVIALPFIYGRNIVLMNRTRPAADEPVEAAQIEVPITVKYRPAKAF